MKIALSLTVALLLSTPVLAQEHGAWIDYRNERFGFGLRYPAEVFEVDGRSEAGHGQSFTSKDGTARLLVGTLQNADGHTPSTYLQYIARHSYGGFTVGYRRLDSSWFVLSGENTDQIFYEKVIFSCNDRFITSFAMLYPIAQRAIFDPVIERMEDSFRAGAKCPRQTPARAVEEGASHPRRPPDRTRQSDRLQAPRSEMADRIARARGRDVSLQLEHTNSLIAAQSEHDLDGRRPPLPVR